MHDLIVQWASYGDGALAWSIIAALFVLSGLVFVPRPAVCILAGLTFGLAAFPLALLSTAAGSLLGFLLARYLARDRFRRIVNRRPKAKLIADAIDSEGWQLLFMLRLASPIPGPVSNYAFGLSAMKTWQFMAVTLVGLAPQVFAFVYLGAIGQVALDDKSVSSIRLGFGIVGFIVLIVAIAMVTRRVRQSINNRIDAAGKS
jgi:uncharacterized membrane protein YdjX (TVP38/TMEM64 family)